MEEWEEVVRLVVIVVEQWQMETHVRRMQHHVRCKYAHWFDRGTYTLCAWNYIREKHTVGSETQVSCCCMAEGSANKHIRTHGGKYNLVARSEDKKQGWNF